MLKRKRVQRSTSPGSPKKKQRKREGEAKLKDQRMGDGKAEQDKGARVRKRRQAYALAPQVGNHVFFLFVGEEHHLLTLHSDLLPTATKTYLGTRFYEQRVCWLREEIWESANLWRLYLYAGNIFSNDEVSDQDTTDTGDEESHPDGEWTKLAHAYLFGQKIQDESFANACITALVEKVLETERFPTGIASEVYAGTQRGDGLRRLIVDLHVFMGEGTCLEPPHEDAQGPAKFLQDVRRATLRASVGRSGVGMEPWATHPCTYHTHVQTERCGLKGT